MFFFIIILEFWLLVRDLDLGTNDIKKKQQALTICNVTNCSKHFTMLTHTHFTPLSSRYYSLHFADWKTEPQIGLCVWEMRVELRQPKFMARVCILNHYTSLAFRLLSYLFRLINSGIGREGGYLRRCHIYGLNTESWRIKNMSGRWR